MVEREAALKIVPRLHRTAADVPGAIRVLRAEQVLHLWFANSLSKLNVKPFNDILGRVGFQEAPGRKQCYKPRARCGSPKIDAVLNR
jgi:hypothetical protein